MSAATPTHRQKTKVLLAGLCSLMLMMGIARFAYTPLLPVMLEQTLLSKESAGWLAAINFMGYLSGALIAALVNSIEQKDKLYRLGIFVAILTTALMATAENMWVWSISRYFAGLSSAAGLLIGSALVLNWLLRHTQKSEMGLHFVGLPLGIVFCSLIVLLMGNVTVEGMTLNWSEQWWWLVLVACLLACPAWFWLPRPTPLPQSQQTAVMQDNPPGAQFFWLMMAAYFCAGYGYVISTTFIVDIVDQQPALQGNGAITFMMMGLAGVPAAILWDKLARQRGYVSALLYAFILKAIGIIVPALTDNLVLILLSAALFGFSFVGLVSLVLTMAGLFYPSKPAKLMGKLTIAYGIAQIGAPAFTGWLAESMGHYDLGLWIASAFTLAGAAIMALLAYFERQAKQLSQPSSEPNL